MARINWITPAGDLGTYPESAEFSLQLEAAGPLAPPGSGGFDPRTTIVGNGRRGEVTVFMPDSKNRWTLSSKNLPGLVRTGSYPNEQNSLYVAPQRLELEWPYRGGLNRAQPTTLPEQGIIGITAAGIALFGPRAPQQIPGLTPGSRFTLNANELVEADIFGGQLTPQNPPIPGQAPTSEAGIYHYTDSRFINSGAWQMVPGWEEGFRHSNGHSRIVGWALDGYPIYGPYGYRNPMDPNSDVALMRPGYTPTKIDPARPRPTEVTVETTAIHTDMVRLRGLVSIGMRLDLVKDPQWQPGSIRIMEVMPDGLVRLNRRVRLIAKDRLNAYYPAGTLIEDWEYSAQPGTSLDSHNGRYCVTPEFPNGTYAYFMTQEFDGRPLYPYIIGPTSFGSPAINNDIAVANLIPPSQLSLTFELNSGHLPPGIQLTPTGLLYGFPKVTDPGSSVARQYDFTIRVKDSQGNIADRGFTINVNNIVPPRIYAPVTDSVTNSFGIYFNSDYVSLQLEAIESNPNANLQWNVARGNLPPGLELDQTGLISGFALAAAAPGPLGSSAFDVGRYDQFVYDFEGSTLSKTYKFTIRLYDGINYVDQDYSIVIYNKQFFRCDNTTILADTTIFTADRDGFEYPAITTKVRRLPSARQNQYYAYKFEANYFNPNTPILWRINAGGAATFDQDGDNVFHAAGVGYDVKGFDQTNLSLPAGLSLDTKTGWLSGTLGTNTVFEQDYEFQITAYVDIGGSLRESTPVTFNLRVLQDIDDLIMWETDTNLGTIENGAVSSININAMARSGDQLSYRVVSGEYLRLPQGLTLNDSGELIGRVTFDYFSLDGYSSPIFFDRRTQTYDTKFSFVVSAFNANTITTTANTSTGSNITVSYANATVYSDKKFTLTVKNINTAPYVNLYMKALLPSDLRSVFRSIVNDPALVTDGILFRPGDPYFGIPGDLRVLAVPGIKAESAATYIANMQDFHFDKAINFGNLRKAVARNRDGSVRYEVLYLEVLDYNKTPEVTSQLPITTPVANTVVRGTTSLTPSIIYPYFGANALVNPISNSFFNMINELVAGVGLQNQGALPEWMTSVQPDTGQPLGFIHALVIAYANPGQGDKLLYRYRSSLEKSGYAVRDIMSTFRFVADRYQIDQTMVANFDTTTQRFRTSKETSFDLIPSTGYVNTGGWNDRSLSALGLKDINSVAYASGYGYIAVGQNSTIVASTDGQQWKLKERFVDLGYSAAPVITTSAGESNFTFDHLPHMRLGDELLRTGAFRACTHSYINSIGSRLLLSANITANIAANTTVEFVDLATGGTIRGNVSANATSGSNSLYLYDITRVARGSPIRLAGIANAASNVTTVAGNLITLRYSTTNVLPAGTFVSFDDQRGNVTVLTTANITANGVSTIRFTSVSGNITTSGNNGSYVPTIVGIPGGTTVRAKFTDITATVPTAVDVLAGAEMNFTSVLTSGNVIGDSQLLISNPTKLSNGLGVFGQAISSYTDAAAYWGSVTNATLLPVTVPTRNVNGTIFQGMRVIGSGLPASSYIADIETSANGALTYIHVGFGTATVTSANNAVLTFVADPVVLDSTVITSVLHRADNQGIVNLSQPLIANVPYKGDSLIRYGLPDVPINSVSYLNGRWIAVTSGGSVIDQLPGAESWNSRPALVYGDLYDVAFGDGKYVAVGSESIIVWSYDLDTWSAPVFVSGSNNLLRSVAYYNGTWVAVGDGGTLLVSNDALAWNLHPVTNKDLRQVAYFGQWVAVGAGGTVLVSSDAITWNVYSAGVSNRLNSITYINNIYYVCGARGLIATSEDLQNWSVQYTPSSGDLLHFASSAANPVAVGADGTILIETSEFVVDWAIRGLAFDQVNYASTDFLATKGYRVADGDTLIFAQQEGFDRPNDGWNQLTNLDNNFDSISFDQSTPVPGYFEKLADPTLPNQRGGVWKVSLLRGNIITLVFQRQINLNQTVIVKNESVKLFYDPAIKPGRTVPAYSPATQAAALATGKTTFDGQGTRFASNKDTYVEPGALDKYLKFPKTGVFR